MFAQAWDKQGLPVFSNSYDKTRKTIDDENILLNEPMRRGGALFAKIEVKVAIISGGPPW